ncbi:C-C motif chemokine 27 isoform X5 [Rattus norvegicus]|nr:C-C motif chemokine 27 isoform X6 [Rattus norvegicus]|eukprot:XP_017448960.1 PREDICTED: C-C motif chemokine 27 isoform X6 [Rattus norvegicus]
MEEWSSEDGCAGPAEPFGARDMSRLRRYEVALEAEEEIYWGCFYFFPWLRMWRRERSSAHPREQKLEPLRGLMSCLSSGLRPAPQRSGRGLLCRTPTAAAQTAGALKI